MERCVGIGGMGKWAVLWLGLAVPMGCFAAPAGAGQPRGDVEYEGFRAYEQEVQARTRASAGTRRGAGPLAIPDIFGAGSVLNVGSVIMKVTNNGILGNPFATSSDPSMQWPGTSAIEYLNFLRLAVGRGESVRDRPERGPARELPPRMAAADARSRGPRCTASYDGIVNGIRFTNDDGGPRPAHGDGPRRRGLPRRPRQRRRRADRRGLRRDRPADVHLRHPRRHRRRRSPPRPRERHVPLGLECRQSAWAYSIPGFTDFNVVNWHFFNRSGHELDSVCIGFRVDIDAGPIDKSNFFSDDFDVTHVPVRATSSSRPKDTDLRKQIKGTHPAVPDMDPDSALCPRIADHGAGVLGRGRRRRRAEDARRAVVHAHRPHHRPAGGDRPEARGLPRVPLVPGRPAVRAGRQSRRSTSSASS